MATDFFQRQDVARRNTSWLVGMFLLSVVAIVAGTYFAAWGACQYLLSEAPELQQNPPDQLRYAPLCVALATIGLIIIGSLFKLGELSGGGHVVAERLGGRRLPPNSTDLTERRLLNVVEEMALASGVPVPPVFLMPDEQGINAFAAGYSPSDAVIGVTRGCAEQLTREELQGVIAHEFSHILNGDMRLNIRLIGVLHGILLLGLIGQMLFRVAAHSGHSRSKDNNGAMFLLLAGVVLLILGYAGLVMGNLIKAAVSRQREFLADASAVQFTRNPRGIAGALKRIGALVFGSVLKHRNAAENSHMYFSQGVKVGLTSLLATHPPLPQRIRALDPHWDGNFPKIPAAVADIGMVAAEAAGLVGDIGGDDEMVPVEVVQHASEQVGHPTERHRSYAAQLVHELPDELVAAAHDPYGARAVLFALLLDRETVVRDRQMAALAELAEDHLVRTTLTVSPLVDELEVRARLPLVDMTLPALRCMSPTQYGEFVKCFKHLVEADERLALFEWCLHHILLRHLKPQFERIGGRQVRYFSLARLAEPVNILLSSLAHAGQEDAPAEQAFRHAAALVPGVRLQLLPQDACRLPKLQAALEQLSHVSAKLRQRLVDACAASICADREVMVREAELLRAVCDMLDCPMPPLLAGQAVEPVTTSAAAGRAS